MAVQDEGLRELGEGEGTVLNVLYEHQPGGGSKISFPPYVGFLDASGVGIKMFQCL